MTEDEDVEAKGEGLRGDMLVLEATGLLTQEMDLGGTTLIDACNGFNELRRLAVLLMVHHLLPVGTRFWFDCYRHWSQLLLHQPDDAPVIILS